MIKICTICNKKYEDFDYLSHKYMCGDCEAREKRKKKRKSNFLAIFVFLVFIISFISVINGITLNSGTILNTTLSNSSMTFSTPINVDEIIINDINITLNNVTCYNGTFISQFFWNTSNTNKDSYDVGFCYYVIPLIGGTNTSYFELPTNLISNGKGLFSGIASWAYNVTGGLFWTLMLLAFCVVMFIGTMRFSTPRAFGWASFVGMLGAIFLVIAQLMSWQIASAFILSGCVGFVVMIMNER